MAPKKNQEAAAPAAPAEPKRVAGVNLQHVSLTALNSALKESGIKVDSKTSLEQRVQLLADFEEEACKGDKKLPEEERKGGVCSVCDGMSQLSRPACPYCGTAEEQPSPVAPVNAPPPKSAKAAKAAKAEKAKDDEPKEETKALAKVADAGKVAKAKAAQIATYEKRIGGLVRDGLVNAWKIGREMAPVFKDGLWKYHLGEDGKPRFKSFGDWVTTIFGLSSQTARNMMAVAENFSEADVRKHGVEKLSVTLRVPEELQAEVLEKAADMSTRELKGEVRRLAPGGSRKPLERNDSAARPHQTRKNAATNAAKAKRVLAPNEVTAVFALQRYEVPMFARAKSADTGEEIRARTLNADPHAVLALHNGVELHLRWVEDESGLTTVVEFKRVDVAETAAE